MSQNQGIPELITADSLRDAIFGIISILAVAFWRWYRTRKGEDDTDVLKDDIRTLNNQIKAVSEGYKDLINTVVDEGKQRDIRAAAALMEKNQKLQDLEKQLVAAQDKAAHYADFALQLLQKEEEQNNA